MDGKYAKLKSGTDVRGVAVGEGCTLTDRAVADICGAFTVWLKQKYGERQLKIAVGNDSRVSAERIRRAACAALQGCGADVLYTGLSSTPSMFILLKEANTGCNASIMITASHLPYDKNGLKFFTPEGGLSGEDIDKILEIAAEGRFPKGKGGYEEKSFMDEYSAILARKVTAECGEKPLAGMKIIVDAGNGAGGFFAEKVLKPLGADISGSIFLEPDGTFPNHVPNPEDKRAMGFLSEAVKKSGADFGIIFDTDVDRAACADKSGEEINRNSLIALLAAMLSEKGKKSGVIVTDSVTSVHLTEFIESLGGKHLRFKRGYKNVIDKCRQLNEAGTYSPLAIETSGHAAFPENYYLDDGAYLVTRLLICLAKQKKEGKSLISLIASLKRPAEESEVRLGFNSQSRDFKKEGERVIEELKELAERDGELTLAGDNYEGARIFYGQSNAIVRMSVHDPVMPVNFESDIKGGNKRTAEKLYGILKRYSFLDLSNLEKYISE